MTQGMTVSREKGIEDKSYKWGFATDIDTELAPKGLSEDTVRFISRVKKEPEWLTAWRLTAYRHWVKLE